MSGLSIFTCPECGHQQAEIFTRCPACGKWLDPGQVSVTRSRQEMHSVAPIESAASATSQPGGELPRISSGFAEVDRVFGGGIAEGSALIVTAPPGTGKSTLFMQVGARVAQSVGPVLYVSGEETLKQAVSRAHRIGANVENLFILADNGMEEVIHEMKAIKAVLVIIDSLQVMKTSFIDNSPGTGVQVKEVSNRIIDLAKRSGVPSITTGQIVKSGEFAGPMTVPHLYDGVFKLDPGTLPGFILLRAEKNRFGSTDEVGSFRMIPNGIEEVANPSAEILGKGGAGIIIVAMEGNKTIATEVQVGFIQRGDLSEAVVGYPKDRLRLIQAVLAQYGIDAPCTISLDVLGGYRIKESSADLAVAIATAYAVSETPLPSGWSAMGEVALDGKLLPPRKFAARFRELEVLGIANCIVPLLGSETFADCKKPIVHRASTLREALNMIGLELPTDGADGRPLEVISRKAVSVAAREREVAGAVVRNRKNRAKQKLQAESNTGLPVPVATVRQACAPAIIAKNIPAAGRKPKLRSTSAAALPVSPQHPPAPPIAKPSGALAQPAIAKPAAVVVASLARTARDNMLDRVAELADSEHARLGALTPAVIRRRLGVGLKLAHELFSQHQARPAVKEVVVARPEALSEPEEKEEETNDTTAAPLAPAVVLNVPSQARLSVAMRDPMLRKIAALEEKAGAVTTDSIRLAFGVKIQKAHELFDRYQAERSL